MKTYEQIFDRVEKRWDSDRAARKKKTRGRVADAILLTVPYAALLYWSSSTNQWAATAIGGPAFVFSSIQLQKRWLLEDRIERLEKSPTDLRE